MEATTVKRDIEVSYKAESSYHKVRVNQDDPTLLEIDYWRMNSYHPWGHCPDGMTWKTEEEVGHFGLVFQNAEAVYV